jgi:hypothetical protein
LQPEGCENGLRLSNSNKFDCIRLAPSLHHRNQLAKRNVMSTATLTSLLDYLYGTLSPNNMRWVGEHLIEYAKKEENEQLRPYTMQEIDEMLDEAEAAFEAGEYLTNDEVFHHKEKVSV